MDEKYIKIQCGTYEFTKDDIEQIKDYTDILDYENTTHEESCMIMTKLKQAIVRSKTYDEKSRVKCLLWIERHNHKNKYKNECKWCS
jgi:hypothetical protein